MLNTSPIYPAELLAMHDRLIGFAQLAQVYRKLATLTPDLRIAGTDNTTEVAQLKTELAAGIALAFPPALVLEDARDQMAAVFETTRSVIE